MDHLQTTPCLLGQIYMLVPNPDKQQLLRDEVDKVAPRGEDVTAEMIDRMPYLRACIKEGFRLVGFPLWT